MAEPTIPYVIRAGDYLDKLAFTRGFDAVAVWNHPRNEALKSQRPDPNILEPGDLLYVPAPDPQTQRVIGGGDNTYSADVPRVTISLELRVGGKPLANASCTVEGAVVDPPPKTDGDGKISFEVPVITRELTLCFAERGHRFQVMIGDMDPHDGVAGARKRLAHLAFIGHDLEALGDAADEIVAAAIERFQDERGLEVTGDLDAATLEALRDAHGR